MVTLTLSSPAKKVKARWSSDCKACGKPILKGETTVAACDNPLGNSRTWWVHDACVGKELDEKLINDDQPKRPFRRSKGQPAPIGTQMASKIESECQHCHEKILVGQAIEKTELGWIHVSCAAHLKQQNDSSQASATQNDNDSAAQPTTQQEPTQQEPVSSELLDKIMQGLAHTVSIMQELRLDNQQLRDRLEQLEAARPKQIVLKTKDGDVFHDVNEHTHPIFERVLVLASARKNVFIPGPTGCGKSHLAKQVATALGLEFAFVSCSVGMSEGHLTGRLLPVGKSGKFEYVISEFVKCYENGGLFLLDEIDAADANVLLVVNAALANGKMAVPNRPEQPYAKRHPDFVCIAAANTWGSGADRQYVGRNQLDNATLDRFRIGQIAMDYDAQLEKQLCPNAELYERLAGYRAKARANRMERAISTRFMIDAYDMVTNHGWSFEDVDNALFADWRADEVAKVQN